ncbi:hypothetical protein BT69DRAFT_1335650 [Atractiella rhizophila]|nr:hypothetical protein BT69DRAFT_1335650 [Atractiella rhizophila]
MSNPIRVRLHNIASRWPKDPLRMRYQFRDSLKTLHKELTWMESDSKPGQPQMTKEGKEPKWDEEGMLNSLERLLKNQAYKRYPTPGSILHPATSPQYFERLTLAFKDGRERYDKGTPVDVNAYLEGKGGLFSRLFGNK